MKNHDCPECAAFAAEMRAALKDLLNSPITSDRVKRFNKYWRETFHYLKKPSYGCANRSLQQSRDRFMRALSGHRIITGGIK